MTHWLFSWTTGRDASIPTGRALVNEDANVPVVTESLAAFAGNHLTYVADRPSQETQSEGPIQDKRSDHFDLMDAAPPLGRPLESSRSKLIMSIPKLSDDCIDSLHSQSDPFNTGFEHEEISSARQRSTFEDQDGRITGPPVDELINHRYSRNVRQLLQEKLPGLIDKRNNVLALRLKVHSVRKSLRNERAELNQHDAQLIQRLRNIFIARQYDGYPTLLDEFEAIQEARNALQPKEDDYDNLEDNLNLQEWELKEAELKLYKGSVSPISMSLSDDRMAISVEEFREIDSPTGHSGSPLEKLPRKGDYISRKRDAEILRGRLDELCAEDAQLLEEDKIRAEVGLDPSAHSLNFRIEFAAHHIELTRKLELVDRELLQLRQELNDEDPTFYQYHQFDGNDMDLSLGSLEDDQQESVTLPDSGDEQDPLRLPSDHTLPIFPFSVHSRNEANIGIGIAAYINHWSLHRLRISSSEIRLYKSAKELANINLDGSEFRDMVLEWWLKDQDALDHGSVRDTAAAPSLNASAQRTQVQRLAATSSDPTAFSTSWRALRRAQSDKVLPTYRFGDGQLL